MTQPSKPTNVRTSTDFAEWLAKNGHAEAAAKLQQLVNDGGEKLSQHFSSESRALIKAAKEAWVATCGDATTTKSSSKKKAPPKPGEEAEASDSSTEPKKPKQVKTAKPKAVKPKLTKEERAEIRAKAKAERAKAKAEERYGTEPAVFGENLCLCGCGEEVTGKNFKPGHDARLKSIATAVASGYLPPHRISPPAYSFLAGWDHVDQAVRDALAPYTPEPEAEAEAEVTEEATAAS